MDHLSLIEFSYNNSDLMSVGMVPFETIYGRHIDYHCVGLKVVSHYISGYCSRD